MSHWFFLSYAHSNRDEYLQKFYHDLNKTIHERTAPGEGADGFFDERDIEVGRHWRPELIAALQNCRTFVSLYTPAYFTSEECGKEWQFFSARQAAYREHLPADAGSPSWMMPILWVPEDTLRRRPLPDAVSAVQYNHSAFGSVYAKEGLKQLIKVSSYHDDYLKFLTSFADKLINAACAHKLPPHPHHTPGNEIESAFHRQEAEVVMYAEEPVNMGPRHVQFVFVAGRRDELRAVREKLDFYGDKGECDWHPFLPEFPREVGIIAQGIASEEDFYYVPVRLDDNVMQRIEEAENHNSVVAILIDTWTLLIPRYKDFIDKYDACNFVNCAVLVPWNNKDDETKIKGQALLNKMRASLKKHYANRGSNCFLKVSSHDEMKKKLPAALHKARARLIRKENVAKKAEGEREISMPNMTGGRR